MKRTYLLGSIILGILAIIGTLVALVATGVIGEAPRTLIFSSSSLECVYDGNAHTSKEWELVSGELKEGHTIEASVLGSQTETGTSENTMTVVILDENKTDVTDSYIVEYKYGKIKVNPKPVKVCADSSSKQYDGEELVCETYEVLEKPIEGHLIQVSFGASRTEVGESENVITTKIIDGNGKDVSHNYLIENVKGIIKVTPHAITIKTNGDEKVYDGKGLTVDGYEIVAGDIMEGHTANIVVTGSQENVGQSENTYAIDIVDKNNQSVLHNYSITNELGILSVLPRQINVSTEGASKTYDGSPITNDIWEITQGEVCEGHKIDIKTTGTQLLVGESENIVVFEVVDEEGNKLTQNYEIVGDYGILEIKPIELIVGTGSTSKDYDETPLVYDDWTLLEGTLLEGHTIDVKVTGVQNVVGTSDNDFVYDIIDISTNQSVSDFYNVTPNYGTLEIRPIAITIMTYSDTKHYDGKPLTKDGYEIIQGALFQGHTLELEVVGIQETAGKSSNTIQYTIWDANNKNATSNYNVTEELGELEILPINLTITTGSDAKPYDGAPITKDEYDIASGELFEGHTLEIDVIGIQEIIGESENVATYDIVDNEGNSVLVNYNVIESFGTLKIYPIGITIQTFNASKVYDGTPISKDGYEHTAGELFPDHVLDVKVVGSRTDVGTSKNDFTVTVFHGEEDVTFMYEIVPVYGELRVTPAQLLISTDPGAKTYDGTPLTAQGYDYDENELIEGHKLTVTTIGSITEAGSAYNYFTYYIENENGENVTPNYEVTASYGKLRVDKRPIQVYTGEGEKVYDGTPLTNDSGWVEVGNVLDGHTITITPYGSQTNVGIGFNNADVTIVDGNNVNVKDNYNVTVVPGPLEITPIQLSILTHTGSHTYNGEEFKLEGYTITRGSVLSSHIISVISTTECINAGEYDNTADVIISANGKEVTRNYQINMTYGKITINPRVVTVRSESDAKVYDGTPLTNDKWRIVSTTKPLDGHTLTVVVTGERTEIGESPNSIAQITIFCGEEDMQNNYDFSLFQEGTLVVKEKPSSEEDGGGGGGGTGTGGSGSLGGGGSSEEYERLMKIKVGEVMVSGTKGSMFLRVSSYGDYEGDGFKNPTPYRTLIDDSFSMQYLTGLALGALGYESHISQIKLNSGYLLPYYLEKSYCDYVVPTNDCTINGDGSEPFSMYHYNYTGTGMDITPLSGEYATLEEDYREFVYENYTSVPQSTLDVLEDIIKEQGFNTTNKNALIEQVVDYITHVATYNLDFDHAMEAEDDIVVAFLTKYKEGVCRHYAGAATVLFRALNIPARFVSGYRVDGLSIGGSGDIMAGMAHAWTEIYIDGVGWIMLEVTGGGSTPPPPPPPDPEKVTITMYPRYVDALYQAGYTLNAVNEYVGDKAFNELMAKYNYRCEVEVSGSISQVGYGTSMITSYKFVDSTGNDVTEKVEEIANIQTKTGVLHLYETIVYITSDSISRPYNGEVLYPEKDGYTIVGLLSGHKESIEFKNSRTNAGASQNYFTAKIYSGTNDVTYRYKIQPTYGTIEVEYIKITLTAETIEAKYEEGKVYTAGWEMTEGALLEGHTIEVTVEGELEGLGSIDTYIDSVVIKNKDGNNVTTNYDITYVDGEIYIY